MTPETLRDIVPGTGCNASLVAGAIVRATGQARHAITHPEGR
jgi:hypothetical protein